MSALSGHAHAEAGDVALRVVEIVVADPGERQIGEHARRLSVRLVEGDGVAGGVDAARRRTASTPFERPVVPEV